MLTPKEIAKSCRTLICLLQALEGRKVLIELRNEHFILGTLQSVDSFMNMELVDAIIWSSEERLREILDNSCGPSRLSELSIDVWQLPEPEFLSRQTHIDYLFLKGNRIRYCHLSDKVDPLECIEQKLANYRRRRTADLARPFNWKTYRKKLKLMSTEKDDGKEDVKPHNAIPSTSAEPH